MKQNVVHLMMVETPVVKTDTMASLLVKKGQETSRKIIEKAVVELADRLWKLEEAIEKNDLALVRRIASSSVAISDQLGLAGFSKVALSLKNCIDKGDPVAIQAVAARFQRVAEWSLYVAVQFPQNAGRKE